MEGGDKGAGEGEEALGEVHCGDWGGRSRAGGWERVLLLGVK